MKFLLAILGVLFGMAIFSAWRDFSGHALAQTKAPAYRVLSEAGRETMERKLNDAVRDGCRPILASGGARSEVMLFLECP